VLEQNPAVPAGRGVHDDLWVEPAAGHPDRRALHRESLGLHHRADRAGRPLDGRTVVTNAAAGNSNVKALVYIAAFVPDVGETQGELINKFPGSEVLPVSVPVRYTKPDGTTGTDFYLGKDGQAAFAADIPTGEFHVLQATQRPFDADSFIYPTTAAAWHTIPSWGLVAGRDKAIPPATKRWMYSRANARKVVEVPTSSHVAMLSHPQIVADLIDQAAKATS
jgi:pimeloyl-ACP methyl ester carboxylesterase